MAEAMPHPHHNIVSPWLYPMSFVVILGPLDYVLAKEMLVEGMHHFLFQMIGAEVSPPPSPSFGNNMAGNNIGEGVPR